MTDQRSEPPGAGGLPQAFDELLDDLHAASAWLQQHPFYADPENRASAYAFLTSMLVTRLEEDVLYDPDFPTFRIVDPRIREGGDNPDQRYLITRLNGGQAYRIWGRMRGETRIDFQIYAGDPYVFGSGGRSAAFLPYEEMTFAADGSFEVIASPERGADPSDWIENPPDGTRLLVRQVYGDWSGVQSGEQTGEVHIDRLGSEGELKPVIDEPELVTRFQRATGNLSTHVHVWPEMLRQFYIEGQEPNRISEPFDPGALGGVSGRYMCHGFWDLQPDEALIVTTWPMGGNYQGIQLTDLWWSSLEYANRQTSLTGQQARAGDGGEFTFVLSAVDPAAANWLDTMGRRRGIVMLRFDGMQAPQFDPAKRPTARVVRLADLPAVLPPGTSMVSAAERAEQIALRRRHVQARFGT